MNGLTELYRRALVERLCLEATTNGDAWEVADHGLRALVIPDPDDLAYVQVFVRFRVDGLTELDALRIANRAAMRLKTVQMGWLDGVVVLSADRDCFPLDAAPSVEELAATVRRLLDRVHAGARLLHDELTLQRLDPDRHDDEQVAPDSADRSADS